MAFDHMNSWCAQIHYKLYNMIIHTVWYLFSHISSLLSVQMLLQHSDDKPKCFWFSLHIYIYIYIYILIRFFIKLN